MDDTKKGARIQRSMQNPNRMRLYEIAVAQAVTRGLATASQLQEKAYERGRRVDMLIMNALKKVKR